MRHPLALLLTALLALLPASTVAQPAPPVPLPVAAELSAGALIVTWPTPVGQAFACIYAQQPDRLLGCTRFAWETSWQQGPGSVDIHALVHQGDTVEVRVYALSGAVAGQGTAGVRGAAAWLPVVVR
jgi:hypothetical protein